jgi:hypothetical protein
MERLKVINQKVNCSYLVVPAVILTNVLGLSTKKVINTQDIQVLFSLTLMAESRLAARCNGSRKNPNYTVEELAKIAGKPKNVINKSLTKLKEIGFITEFSKTSIEFNETAIEGTKETLIAVNETSRGDLRNPSRKIPLPKKLIKFLISENKIAFILGIISSALRCFSFDKDGKLKAVGSMKNSWIASVSGISLRSAQNLRSWLILQGWLKPDTKSHQLKLNRTGAYCEFDLEKIGTVATPDNLEESADFAYPPPKKNTDFAYPIYKNYNLLPTEEDYKNHNGGSDEPKPKESSGVCKQTKPKIKNIKLPDLVCPIRLELLYRDAIETRLITDSVSSRLNFIATTIRSLTLGRAGKGDTVRIFAGIIRRKLFHVISQHQEEQARAFIREHYGDISQFGAGLPRKPSLELYKSPPVRDLPLALPNGRVEQKSVFRRVFSPVNEAQESSSLLEAIGEKPQAGFLSRMFEEVRQRIRRERAGTNLEKG